MLKMPEPMWMLLVLAATKARKDSEADRWEYSVRKWCSDAQVYLKPALSAATMKATSSMMRSCSADSPCSSTYLGSTHAALKMPNSMGFARPRLRCRGPFRRLPARLTPDRLKCNVFQ
jgi:hypothetical protein